MALQREQIFQAADALVEQGINPTLAAVRKALGSGSFTTIQEYMSEWRAERSARQEPIREAAPRTVNERLEVLGAEIWATAMEMANARLAADREAFEAHRLEMEKRQAEAAEMADQLAEELEASKEAMGRLEAERSRWSEEKQALEGQLNQLSALVEKHKALHAAADERADDFRMKTLSAEKMLEREQKEAAAVREALARMRGVLEVLERQNQALIERVGSPPEEKKRSR